MFAFRRFAPAIAVSLSLVSVPAFAQEPEAFYKNKTIDMVIGYSPGGGYDQYARLVAAHLGKFIPGNPEIIPMNRPGAGGLVAATYMHDVAPKDGTVIGIVGNTLPIAQATGDPKMTIDSGAFGYIGTPVVENNVFVTWHDSGVASVADAKQKEIPIGATGSTSSTVYPKIMNALLGTRFKIVSGYAGGNDINMAMEAGEVAGRAGENWASLKRRDWYEKGLVNIIAQIGIERDPDLPDVPLLTDFAENDEQKKILLLLSSSSSLGRPFLTTPGVPDERVQMLRDAFDKMVKDPEFLADAKTQKLAISPLSGARLQEIVDGMLATPPELGKKLGELGGLS